MHRLTIEVLPAHWAVCRLAPDAAVPQWASDGAFVSMTRTQDELSIVCLESRVPANVKSARGWCVLKLAGPFEFSAVGVLHSVTSPLAAAGISLFAVSTFDTDYVLVQDASLSAAVAALRDAGHTVMSARDPAVE